MDKKRSNCAHIKSLGSASDVSALRDIVETGKALLVQNGVEKSQSGQPDAQPIVVQEGDQSGHDWRRCRGSSSERGIPNPEESVADRESGNVGDSLQVSTWKLMKSPIKNIARLRKLKTRCAHTTVPANANTKHQNRTNRGWIGTRPHTDCIIPRRVLREVSRDKPRRPYPDTMALGNNH